MLATRHPATTGPARLSRVICIYFALGGVA